VAGQAARAFPAGAWLADLSAVLDPAQVPQAVVNALGIVDRSISPAADKVAGYFADAAGLIVLDNCEHVRAACAAFVDRLLSQARGVVVLATSRTPLGIPGEQLFAVPPLSVPGPAGATHTVNPADQDAAAAIAEITGGHGVASSIDTTAVPAVLRTAVDALGIRGSCAVIGAPPQGTEVSFEVQSLLPGKRIIGVTLGDAEPETLIPQLAALHRAGRLPLEKLIRYYPLAGLDDAARDMHEGATIKPVIRFPEEA
jgi:Zinc-binding dehydrogenase